MTKQPQAQAKKPTAAAQKKAVPAKAVNDAEKKTRHRLTQEEAEHLESYWAKDIEKWPKSKCEQVG